MTLDEAEIDLSKSFETGQGYVALSRVKSLEGLKLIGYNDYSFELNDLAFKADKRFQELSEFADAQNDIPFLETLFDGFVKKCGGLVNKEEIDKFQRKREAKKNKLSTYEQTKLLVDKSMAIKDIAKERGLTTGTVIGHILKLADSYPNLNLEAYKPDAQVAENIAVAAATLSKNKENLYRDGSLKSTPIYSYFNRQYTYDEIKLALLFFKGKK